MFNLEQRKNYIKTRNDTDYTDTVKVVYEILAPKYSYRARISDIFQLLKDAFGVSEFIILNYQQMNNAPFESWLVNQYISWKKGGEVDFIEIYKAILTVGEFTISERELFESGLVEERLWAIFMLIDNPELNI